MTCSSHIDFNFLITRPMGCGTRSIINHLPTVATGIEPHQIIASPGTTKTDQLAARTAPAREDRRKAR